MRIRGSVDLEGITLLVDIEAPDDEKELWVTNVHPNCLVIPRERWKIEYLGLAQDIINELKEKGITNLSDLLEPGTWKIKAKFSFEIQEAVLKALQAFQEVSLLSASPEIIDEKKLVVPVPVPLPEAKEIEKVKAVKPSTAPAVLPVALPDSLDASIADLPIKPHIIRALKARWGAITIRKLIDLGAKKLIMTPNIMANDIQEIQQVLEQVQAQIAVLSESKSTEGGVDLSAHLASQGLRKAREG